MSITTQEELETIFEKLRDFNIRFPGMRFLQLMQLFLATHLDAEDFYRENRDFIKVIDRENTAHIKLLKKEFATLRQGFKKLRKGFKKYGKSKKD